MIKNILVVFACICSAHMAAQNRQPIIDMHVHGYGTTQESWGVPSQGPGGIIGSTNSFAHFNETYKQFQKHNIVKAVVSDTPAGIEAWRELDEEDRVISALYMDSPTDYDLTPPQFEELVKAKKVQVFGEIGAYYSGTTLSDSEWDPYLEICARYNIPVAIHSGGGAPGGTYSFAPKARLMLGDPYLIEDVLVKYPNLRIYLMHAGEEWHEHTLRLMEYYPQLYTDIAVLLWVSPNAQRYARDFLRNAKEAGLLDRVMFGSDQMEWPQAFDISINYLNSLDFLSEKDLENIYYNNAVQFLGLEK